MCCAALTIFALALYQHLAAVLRGIRAYSASASMEVISAALFLAFATLAAWRGGAMCLIIAYGASVVLPLSFFAAILRNHLSGLAAGVAAPITASTDFDTPRFRRFAAWSFIRLLLMMTFSAVSIVGVGYLVDHDAAKSSAAAHDITADYAMPYRIAQILSYVGLTLWASTYGIAARAWSHGQIRRAHVQLFRVGKFGAVLLTLLAVALLLRAAFSRTSNGSMRTPSTRCSRRSLPSSSGMACLPFVAPSRTFTNHRSGARPSGRSRLRRSLPFCWWPVVLVSPNKP